MGIGRTGLWRWPPDVWRPYAAGLSDTPTASLQSVGQYPVPGRPAVGGGADDTAPVARRDAELHLQLSSRRTSGRRLARSDLLELAAMDHVLNEYHPVQWLAPSRRSL